MYNDDTAQSMASYLHILYEYRTGKLDQRTFDLHMHKIMRDMIPERFKQYYKLLAYTDLPLKDNRPLNRLEQQIAQNIEIHEQMLRDGLELEINGKYYIIRERNTAFEEHDKKVIEELKRKIEE